MPTDDAYPLGDGDQLCAVLDDPLVIDGFLKVFANHADRLAFRTDLRKLGSGEPTAVILQRLRGQAARQRLLTLFSGKVKDPKRGERTLANDICAWVQAAFPQTQAAFMAITTNGADGRLYLSPDRVRTWLAEHTFDAAEIHPVAILFAAFSVLRRGTGAEGINALLAHDARFVPYFSPKDAASQAPAAAPHQGNCM